MERDPHRAVPSGQIDGVGGTRVATERDRLDERRGPVVDARERAVGVGEPRRSHAHGDVRRWTIDGAVASLLVYAPTRGAWFEGDDMPADVRAFVVDALAVYIGEAPVFTAAAGVRP